MAIPVQISRKSRYWSTTAATHPFDYLPTAKAPAPLANSTFSKSSAIVRPAEPALSWIALRIREALRGGRHEGERFEPKDTLERFWGLKFIGFPNLSDETPKPKPSALRHGASLTYRRLSDISPERQRMRSVRTTDEQRTKNECELVRTTSREPGTGNKSAYFFCL